MTRTKVIAFVEINTSEHTVYLPLNLKCSVLGISLASDKPHFHKLFPSILLQDV